MCNVSFDIKILTKRESTNHYYLIIQRNIVAQKSTTSK